VLLPLKVTSFMVYI